MAIPEREQLEFSNPPGLRSALNMPRETERVRMNPGGLRCYEDVSRAKSRNLPLNFMGSIQKRVCKGSGTNSKI
ncbi:hypothetical protein PILCRDRAFT_810096 [Piloderma croceum F 1598]|uniref:Uncharacterized protein n=1 Tax=Piloderma croceum (strain F 1598) TaxID=765440 RepID=A0A0C3CQZ8_PILCF|nr:hypothetical protein PILCRDRAFT_810096 [Piloderma croceum F 1598]